MTALVIVLTIILFIGSWILFVPIVIDVDTVRAVYSVYQTGTFRFWLEKDFQPKLRLVGLPAPIRQQKEVKVEVQHREKKKGKPVSIHRIRLLIKRVFQSIRIKRFQVDIDTDDVVVNAQLIPALLFLSRGPVQLTANFEGRVSANLLAEVRLYRLVWAMIEFFTKK